MSINSSKYYINTSTMGMVIDLAFGLKGDIVPRLYEVTGGIVTFIGIEDSRVYSLSIIGPNTFRAEFIGTFEGFLELFSIVPDALSTADEIKLINSTLSVHGKAISERVYIEAWKGMNTYFEAEVRELAKQLEQANAKIKRLESDVSALQNE